MLNLKVIGAGAAGNKAAINLIEKGFNQNDVLLINSTSKDIPEEYRDISMIFGSSSNNLGGCGKERDIGKRLIINDMKYNNVSLDNFADPDTKAIIIVSSTEGGSGSASTPILAKYVREVLDIPVIVCLFFGFNTDVRGMQNSIEICQELTDNYGVIGIANSKFVNEANGNYRKAETMANDHFTKLVDIIMGKQIVPSGQNIDDTDLYKLITTPGYMKIEQAHISKIKNTDQFNKAVSSAIDESHLMDCPEGAKRAGYIFDITDSISDAIDYNIEVVKSTYGTPYEIYTQVQTTDNPSTVTWIISGLPLPINEIKEIYDNYLKNSSTVNKSKDSFFDSVSDMRGNEEDEMFDMLGGRNGTKKSRANFFADLGEDLESPKAESNSNGGIKVTTKKQQNGSDAKNEY